MKYERLRIGNLSRETGIKVVTIRYFEQAGLLSEPERSDSGQRLYGAEAVARLRFVRRARDLEFSHDQIRGSINLSRQRGADCSDVDAIAAQHLADVEQRIADLEELASELRATLAACRGTGTIGACRVMEALVTDPDR